MELRHPNTCLAIPVFIQYMRLLLLEPSAKRVSDLGTWPQTPDQLLTAPPSGCYYWLSCDRDALEAQLPLLQQCLQALCGCSLVDLHVSDLLNAQIPSNFDYTSEYDVLLFRRLQPVAISGARAHNLRQITTAAVGYAVFDNLLLSVHSTGCPVTHQSLQRLLQPASAPEKRATPSRLPSSSADLMLRQLNLIVDDYLNLRRDMARQIEAWQVALLHPKSRFKDWESVLQARLALHQLDELCEDQRSAIQDWMDSLLTWQDEHSTKADQRALELLRVRSRDVLEHIERVIHHVRRMEQSAETAVQMHFSAQSNRANDIMRTLTTLTAIFLPLNLIAAVFGMNFDVLPLVHAEDGFWWAMGAMGVIGAALLLFFWRRRYIERDSLLGESD